METPDDDRIRSAAHMKRWDRIGRWIRRISAALIIVGVLLAVVSFAT